MIKDADIREVLLRELKSKPENWVREEVGVFEAVIDVLTVQDVVHGYEIKSAADNLTRLPVQVANYNTSLERISLVVSPCHLEGALKIIPEWWGVISAGADDQGVHLDEYRPAQDNPEMSIRRLAKMLWNDEIRNLLELKGAATGVRGKSAHVMISRLRDHISLVELKEYVRARLRARIWRNVQ
jgi:hypothetical protein